MGKMADGCDVIVWVCVCVRVCVCVSAEGRYAVSISTGTPPGPIKRRQTKPRPCWSWYRKWSGLERMPRPPVVLSLFTAGRERSHLLPNNLLKKGLEL